MTIQYCCGVGALAKLALGPSGGTISRMDFIDFNPKIVKVLTDGGSKAIRGTLDEIDTDVGEGMLFVHFRTRFYVTSAKMLLLLPLLGFTVSTNTWTLVDSFNETKIVVGNAGGDEHTYDGCVPTDFMIVGQKGTDPVMIDIGWVGKTFATAAAGTFFTSQSSPAMTEGIIYPYPDGVNNTTTLVWNSTTLLIPQIQLHVNFHTIEEFLNSVNLTNACPTRHDITFATSALYSTCDGTTALFTAPMAGTITGGSLIMDLQTTVGTVSTAHETRFTIANAKSIARPPRIVKNDFERLPLNFRGYSASGVAALVCLNVVGS